MMNKNEPTYQEIDNIIGSMTFYKDDLSLDDAAALAIAAINLKAEAKDGVSNIKMAKVTSEAKIFEKVSESDLQNYSQNTSKFAAQ